MGYTILAGIAITILLTISYIIIDKNKIQTDGLSWKKCILFGLQIYLITLFLGSLATSIVQNASEHQIIEFLRKVIVQTFGLLMYAVLFTFFLVLPVLIICLRLLSKMSLNPIQKQIRFTLISIGLVLLINLIMSGFLASFEFMIFLAGFSFFGIVTPWAFVKFRKVFEELD